MKKKAIDRARRKSNPCFFLIWTRFVTANQNHKINLPFVKGDLCFSCASAAQKPETDSAGREKICCHHVLCLTLTEED